MLGLYVTVLFLWSVFCTERESAYMHTLHLTSLPIHMCTISHPTPNTHSISIPPYPRYTHTHTPHSTPNTHTHSLSDTCSHPRLVYLWTGFVCSKSSRWCSPAAHSDWLAIPLGAAWLLKWLCSFTSISQNSPTLWNLFTCWMALTSTSSTTQKPTARRSRPRTWRRQRLWDSTCSWSSSSTTGNIRRLIDFSWILWFKNIILDFSWTLWFINIRPQLKSLI